MAQFVLMTFFPALVVGAGLGDFLTMRIPNWLNIVIAASMVPAALLAGMPWEVFQWHLLAGAVTLAVGFGLFAGGVVGGGDAKLLAAAALWIGWSELLPFAVYTALAGGALAIVMKMWQLARIETEVKGSGWLKQVIRSDLDLPYGVAIAIGAVTVYPVTWWIAPA